VTSNVELVRGICAAWERGDFSSAEWADPEIEFAIVDGPEPAHLTGLAAMANRWREQLRAWSDVRPKVDEYRAIPSAGDA
jgi:hypothetical protein